MSGCGAGKEVNRMGPTGGVVSYEQKKEIASDLTQFVHRVALDKNASPAEISALPEIAKVLVGLMPFD